MNWFEVKFAPLFLLITKIIFNNNKNKKMIFSCLQIKIYVFSCCPKN